MAYFLIALDTAAAGFLQGLAGYGGGIVMMICLPRLFPLTQAAALAGTIGIVLNGTLCFRRRKFMSLRRTLPPSLIYMAAQSICIYYSTMINQALLKKVFGVFLIVLAIYNLFFSHSEKKKLSLPVSILFWAISGACDGFFAIGGPLMAIYFLGQSDSVDEYYADLQTVFFITSCYATVVRFMNHIIGFEHIPYIAVGIVCIVSAAIFASRFTRKIDDAMLKKLVYGVVALAGITNII